jgi:hypothetical protein
MSVLTTIQEQCADRLQADSMFANVPVLTERVHDLQSEINIALGPLNGRSGRSGLVAVVLTPTANVNFSDVFGPFFDDIRITVRVLENVTQNQDATSGTGIPAAALAEQVCNLLHHFQPDNSNGPIVARKPTLSLVPDTANLVYHCRFKTSGGPRNIPPQLSAPGITHSGGIFTLTTDTPGAAIFYTLDGSNPSPRNGEFYTSAITPATGNTLKARAWMAGYLASPTAIITT